MFGYYQLECEARLALDELKMKRNLPEGRARLTSFATATRSRRFELSARQAEQAITTEDTLAANNGSH